jgi:sorting nexin-8
MSLFGSSPIESEAANATSHAHQKSLFEEEPTPGAASNASLFDDDTNGNAASPWDFSTPKKAATGDLVKKLLPASDVPESYIDAYDLILDSGDRFGAGMSLNGVKKLLTLSDLKAEDQARILDLVIPSGQEPSAGLGRTEFNVLIALIGLGRENEDITLDGVDERRKSG